MNIYNRPKKRFSQNFLQNPHYQKKIVDALEIKPDDIVIEIGPGQGAITQHIIKAKPRQYYAIEIDTTLAEKLTAKFPDQIKIITQDFLEFEFNSIAESADSKLKIIGNLPYHITSPILFKLIENYTIIGRAVLMIQKEVAKRISAAHDNKEYGILSVISQVYAQVEYLFEVKRGNFYPVPAVDSAVIQLTFYNELEGIENESLFRKIVRETFNYRRKMLRNSLGRIFDKTVVYSISSDYLGRRPEQLSVNEFKTLSNLLNQVSRQSNG
ncbi:MAG TPA: ribosomal RNA small subunit methyltransferase A [Caldithrix sp.]|nr:ribosomal RNA small subunit methyltransferase A [Caldithrix sp.]